MSTPHERTLLRHHPHLTTPVIVGAPTRPFALHAVAIAVTEAGGLGVISSTPSDRTELAAVSDHFAAHPLTFPPTAFTSTDARTPLLPIGIGYLCWMTSLGTAIADLKAYPVQAVWLYAWKDETQLQQWVSALQLNCPETTIYIQICSIASALSVLRLLAALPPVDFSSSLIRSKQLAILGNIVLIAQGNDAGGHGATVSASLMTLLPELCHTLRTYGQGYETIPVLGAGGIIESHSAAAAMVLGAAGVVLGTRLLAATEMSNANAFKEQIVNASDGGINTVRTRLFDTLRGTAEFPAYYDGRALRNRSLREYEDGVEEVKLKHKYKIAEERYREGQHDDNDAQAFGENGRLTSYAGTGIGLVRSVMPAGDIVREIREGVKQRTFELASKFS